MHISEFFRTQEPHEIVNIHAHSPCFVSLLPAPPQQTATNIMSAPTRQWLASRSTQAHKCAAHQRIKSWRQQSLTVPTPTPRSDAAVSGTTCSSTVSACVYSVFLCQLAAGSSSATGCHQQVKLSPSSSMSNTSKEETAVLLAGCWLLLCHWLPPASQSQPITIYVT